MGYKDEIGIWCTMNDGNRARIVGGTYKNLTVEWEDGYRREGICYNMFKQGGVSKEKHLKGEEWLDSVKGIWHTMNDGNKARIISGTYKNLTVEWEDRSQRKGVPYDSFKMGKVSKVKQLKGEEWLNSIIDGKYYKMNDGNSAKIVGGTGCNSVTVEFEDGTKRYGIRYGLFKERRVTKEKKLTGKEWINNITNGKYYRMADGNFAKIVGGTGYLDVVVEWEDGSRREGVHYSSFINGHVAKEKILQGEEWINSVKGKYHMMHNGILAKVVSGTATNMIVEWEDGNQKTGVNYEAFKKGNVGYKTLSIVGKYVKKGSKIKTFDIYKIAFRNEADKSVYYECKCRECGEDGILTPHEMLIHKCK